MVRRHGNAATFGIEGLWVSVDNENDSNFNITPIGTFRPAGGPTVNVFAPAIGNNDSEFFIARANLTSSSHVLRSSINNMKRPGQPGPFSFECKLLNATICG